jgi:hypothetical protein
MSDNKESIGIMDPAFFVGKNILIKWVNDLLDVNVGKVEEMATGAYYCQLLDMIYRDPPLVSLSKVNFAAKFDYEFVKKLEHPTKRVHRPGHSKVCGRGQVSESEIPRQLGVLSVVQVLV